MPRIISAASSFPEHCYSQAVICDAVTSLFAGNIPGFNKVPAIFDNARIAQRQFVMPLEWYLSSAGRAERHKVYFHRGLELAAAAAESALSRANVPPEAVTHVVFVSSTGLATPTIDAYLINLLKMKQTTKRLPLWGLGCAAGAGALARAAECAAACSNAVVLVVAMECCSLTFHQGDMTKKNVIATSLFGDGAAAAVVAGDAVPLSGVEIVATESHLFPDSYRIMGWDMVDEGMQLVLSPKLPAFIRKELSGLMQAVQEKHRIPSLDFYITHPGGAKIIDAYQDALSLGPEALSLTDASLRNHGNVSSVSVLDVLESWLSGQGTHGGCGLLSAFGPGFSAELVVLRES